MIMPKLLSILLICISSFGNSQTIYPTSYSLNPYSGNWSTQEATHLLRRTLFGATYDQIQNAIADGMNVTVDKLLVATPWGDLPLTYLIDDSVSAIGTDWVTSVFPVTNKSTVNNAREKSLLSWKIDKYMLDDSTIAQKMDLFWHNHFGLEFGTDARTIYSYWELIRTHSLGNFKMLIKEMTVEPAMLQFLNGEYNLGSNPNENYSRELLELFTIGKGLDLGNGDFTRYTELDVTEGAKILSGFSNEGIRSETIATPYSIFTSANHDNTAKTLSYHFNGATIVPNGAVEYEDYIDVIFSHPDFAEFICEEIYHFFVNDDITNEVKNLVIPEMAATLTNNDFDVLPVMSQLFRSEHFFDVALRGCLLKSPLDYVMSIYNGTDSYVNFDFDSDYKIRYKIHNELKDIGMDISWPPSVAGWPAYYQSPGFSRMWLSAVHLQKRYRFIDTKIASGGISQNGNTFKIDALGFLNGLPTPSDPVAVIDNMIEVFVVGDLHSEDKLMLKNILTDNLPDFEWTVLYSDYLMDPAANESNVTDQIKSTLGALFKIYMFQTF